MKLFLMCLMALSLAATAALAGGPCGGRMNDTTNREAHAYMEDHGLIHQGEERDFTSTRIRWELLKVIPENDKACLAVMALCALGNDGSRDCTLSYEVLGLIPGDHQDSFVPFERVHPVRSQVVAKIGSNPLNHHNDTSYYYALLSGDSAVAATKSVVANVPYAGFSGITVKGVKASFDPTLHRNWHTSNAEYSLRRGLTAEVLDIQAYQLDAPDAEGIWQGCEKPNNLYGKCFVAPWVQAYIRGLTN